MLHQLNNRCRPNGSPVGWVFFLKTELSAPPTGERVYPTKLQPGQLVMVNLPSIGSVPITLINPRGSLAWEATSLNYMRSSRARRRTHLLFFFERFCQTARKWTDLNAEEEENKIIKKNRLPCCL